MQKLHEAFMSAAREPNLTQRVEEFGLTVATSTPDEMRHLLIKEVADIGQLVRTLGLANP